MVPATDELPEGVIFVLKNINNSVNVDNRNRIHPFYMVYIGMDGQIICDYLNPKKMLDDIRLLCRGKTEPIKEVYERFNRETDDGKDMAEMSELLSEAIDSIIDVMETGSLRRPRLFLYRNHRCSPLYQKGVSRCPANGYWRCMQLFCWGLR